MLRRQLSLTDRLIQSADRALKTLIPGATAPDRPSPAQGLNEATLNEQEKRHIAGLMRVNHTGEVCAQALYQGQALTARSDKTREAMRQAAIEEQDHLAWCEQRLTELDSRTSYLNPLFYSLSFGMGAAAGLLGDKYSLGFVAATEDQVCEHLSSHLKQLPVSDEKSAAIISTMLEDEAEHATHALAQGGKAFSATTKRAMSSCAKVMTKSCYHV